MKRYVSYVWKRGQEMEVEINHGGVNWIRSVMNQDISGS